MNDYEEIASSMEECVYCHSFCKSITPAFEITRNVSYLPSNISYLFNLYMKEEIRLTDNFAKIVFSFIGSKLCDEYCIYSNKNFGSIIRYIRETIYSKKKELLPPQILKLIANAEKSGNIFGVNIDLCLEEPKKNQYDVLVFCGSIVKDKTVEILEDFIKILHYFGIQYRLMENEVSSGAPLFNLGITHLFREIAQKNCKVISQHDPPAIVTLDPYDFKAITEGYNSIGIDLGTKIMNYPEFFNGLIHNERFKTLMKNKLQDTVTVYDPIDAGVDPRFYYDSREVITNFTCSSIKEFFRNRSLSRSCGGYLEFYNGPMAELLINKILDDFQKIPSDYLITTDPLSYYVFSNYSNGEKGVLNLITYIAQLLN
jgi:Fe-S oxidoreductase